MSENKQVTKIIIIGQPQSGKSRLAAIVHNALVSCQLQHFDVDVLDKGFAFNPHRNLMEVTVRDTPQHILIDVRDEELNSIDDFPAIGYDDVANPFCPKGAPGAERLQKLYASVKKAIIDLHKDLWMETSNEYVPPISIFAPTHIRAVEMRVQGYGGVTCPLQEVEDVIVGAVDLESEVIEYFMQKYMQFREEILMGKNPNALTPEKGVYLGVDMAKEDDTPAPGSIIATDAAGNKTTIEPGKSAIIEGPTLTLETDIDDLEKELEDDASVVHDEETDPDAQAKIDLEIKAREEDGIELDRRMTLENMRIDYKVQYEAKDKSEQGT